MIFIIIFCLLICLIYLLYNYYFIENFTPINALTDYKSLKDNINLLQKFVIFTENNNLEYWAIGGTLLGAVRDKGMIPWDDDLDVSMIKSEVNKLLSLQNNLNEIGLGIVSWFGGYKLYELNGKEIAGLNYKYPFIDIFTMIENKNGDFIYENEKTRSYWNDIYYKNKTYPLVKYPFEDFYIYCPNNAIEFLNEHYKGWQKKAIKTYDHLEQKHLKPIEFEINYYNLNKPNLWLYWDNLNNNTEYGYIELCYQSVLKNCSQSFNIVRLNQNNIIHYLPELKEYEKLIKKLKIEHKVDLYRIMLLYKYGGLYLDSDIIIMKDPIEIMDNLKKYDFVGFGCTGDKCKYGYGKPSNWALVSRPNTLLMGNIMTSMIEKIKTKTTFNYHDLGKLIIWEELDKLIKNKNYKYFHYPNTIDGTRDKFGNWVTSEKLFSNDVIEYDDEDNLFFVVLYNSETTNNIKKIDKKKLLNYNCNFTKFIKKSLNI